MFFIKAAFTKGLYLYKQLIISDTKSNPPVRCILCFTKETVVSVSQESIIMKKENGDYTKEYKKLMFIQRMAKTEIMRAKVPRVKDIIKVKKKKIEDDLISILENEIGNILVVNHID